MEEGLKMSSSINMDVKLRLAENGFNEEKEDVEEGCRFGVSNFLSFGLENFVISRIYLLCDYTSL